MPTSETDEWMTKAQACRIFKISQRNLQRKVQLGLVTRRELPKQPSQKVATPVFHRGDLERLHQAAKQGKSVTPASATALVTQKHSPAVLALAAPPALEAVLHALAEILPNMTAPKPPPLWCTIAQASEWSGLPPGWLKRACEAGTVEAMNVSLSPKRVVWRVNRDALGEAQGGFVFSAGA